MNANAEIIAELRRVLNERDEAREQLDLTKRELGRWVDREAKALRARDELMEQRARMAEQIATLDRNAEMFFAEACEARRKLAEKHSECPDCAMWAERSARWHDDMQRAERERDEALASVADAYRRSAEAMREACAVALMSDGLVLSRERAANVVRTIQIPEEP